jgi:hypothetical protein
VIVVLSHACVVLCYNIACSTKLSSDKNVVDFVLKLLVAHGARVFSSVDADMVAANPVAAAKAAFLAESSLDSDALRGGPAASSGSYQQAQDYLRELRRQWASRSSDPATAVVNLLRVFARDAAECDALNALMATLCELDALGKPRPCVLVSEPPSVPLRLSLTMFGGLCCTVSHRCKCKLGVCGQRQRQRQCRCRCCCRRSSH